VHNLLLPTPGWNPSDLVHYFQNYVQYTAGDILLLVSSVMLM